MFSGAPATLKHNDRTLRLGCRIVNPASVRVVGVFEPPLVCLQQLCESHSAVPSCNHLDLVSMRGAAAAAFLVLSGASADICTGKPRTVSELREQWFGGPDHVWPRRNTSYDKRTRPNLAQRWVGRDTDAEAGKPPEARADDVWAVLQVRA
jgi:hypothetical protein